MRVVHGLFGDWLVIGDGDVDGDGDVVCYGGTRNERETIVMHQKRHGEDGGGQSRASLGLSL